MEILSYAARARLGYLLGLAEISHVHPLWRNLATPFSGVKSGYGSVGFWMSDNNKESKTIKGTNIPVDELAYTWGLCAGAPISLLRRSLKGEIL